MKSPHEKALGKMVGKGNVLKGQNIEGRVRGRKSKEHAYKALLKQN